MSHDLSSWLASNAHVLSRLAYSENSPFYKCRIFTMKHTENETTDVLNEPTCIQPHGSLSTPL